MQQTVNQLVTKAQSKRCLIGLQKGVNKGRKGHLLQAKRALIERQFTPLRFSMLELYLQDRRRQNDKKRQNDRMTKNDRIIKRDRRAEEDRMTKKTEG